MILNMVNGSWPLREFQSRYSTQYDNTDVRFQDLICKIKLSIHLAKKYLYPFKGANKTFNYNKKDRISSKSKDT